MLMSGSWHIYRPGERWKRSGIDMRIVIKTERMIAVAFNVPVAEFHTAATVLERLAGLGPRILGERFDEAAAVLNLESRPELTVADALLAQSLLAGIGNVFKSEVCFVAGIHPFRLVGTLRRTETERLVAQSRRLLLASRSRGYRNTTGRLNPSERSWVYGRSGEPCRRCGTAILGQKQAPGGRVTFWCPQCQPGA
jgi:endonuclease-8